MMLTLFLSISLLASTPSQSPPLDSLMIRRVLDSARVLHLPEAPLRSLIAEGRQRRESDARIAAALRSYFDALQKSRTALGARASDTEVDAGASVIISGGSPTTLTSVRSARKDGDLTVALVVLADLVERGVPLTRAEDAVVTLVKVGATDGAFNAFRAGVQQDLASGQGAETSLIKRTRETVTQLKSTSRRENPGRSFELEDARIVVAPRSTPAVTTSDALMAGAGMRPRTLWSIAAQSTPFARAQFFAVRGAIAGSFEDLDGRGSVSGEVIPTIGRRRESGGVEAGMGAAAYTGFVPRSPIAYAAAWTKVLGAEFRLEGRFAGGRAHSTTTTRDLERLETVAFASGDTTINPPVQTKPTIPRTDSTPSYTGASQQSSISELRFSAGRSFGSLFAETSAGLRFVEARPLDSWNSFSITAPLTGRFSTMFGFTSRRAMGITSVPSTSHVFAGFRLLGRGKAVDQGASAAMIESSVPRAELVSVSGSYTIDVFASGARSVEIMGDFTEWQPASMTTSPNGSWRYRLAGQTIYRLLIRIDGSEWFVPAGIARARGAFGGEIGVVTLPEAKE